MAYELACAPSDVRRDEALAVSIGDLDVAIARVPGEEGDDFFAVHDLCTHAQVALSEGEVEGGTIECWLHGSRFDLTTGAPSGPPATDPVATFPIEVRADGVYVDTSTTLNGVTPA